MRRKWLGRRAVPTAGLAVALAACGGSSAPVAQPTPSSTPAVSASALPLGKADLDLGPGDYGSPAGFEPALTVTLTEPWHSVHRGMDAFDISRPAARGDVPKVAVIVLTPARSAARVVADVARRFGGRVTHGRLLGAPARVTTVVGGTGEMVHSRDGVIGLYGDKGQFVRLTGAKVGGYELVVVVLVPKEKSWPMVRGDVRRLLGSIHLA